MARFDSVLARPCSTATTGERTADGIRFPHQETKHVNFTGDDGNIHELWWNFDGWRHNNLSAL